MSKKSKKKADWYREQSLAYAQVAFKAPKVKQPKLVLANSDADAYDRLPAFKFVRRKRIKQPRLSKFRARYLNHLKSNKWRKFIGKIAKQRGKACEDCGSKKQLHGHHLTYDNLGNEKPEDVRILCKLCHEKTHGRKF